MISLQVALVREKFLGPEDGLLLAAWVEDLRLLGYQPPKLIPKTSCSTHHVTVAPKTDKPKRLAWILHFTREPNPVVVDMLVRGYAQYFLLIVIVSPTGRPGVLGHSASHEAEVLWSSGCRNSLDGIPGGAMVRCYVRGLRILSSRPTFNEIEYIVLSNDDVFLNISKIQEFASSGRPASQGKTIFIEEPSGSPLMFADPLRNPINYEEEWSRWKHWPQCQALFAKIPEGYKSKFRMRHGEFALTGAADVFFLPSNSVQEFVQLGSIVSECWLEITLANVLAMLSNPTQFFESSQEVFVYGWGESIHWGKNYLRSNFSSRSMVALHPFKLSDPENQIAFTKLTGIQRGN